MNNQFIPYEQALALRELGFDEPCFTTYDHVRRLRNPFDYAKSEYDEVLPYIEDTEEWIHNSNLTLFNFNGAPALFVQFIAAPLWQQAFDWFRKKHMIKGEVIHADSNGSSKFTIWKWNFDNVVGKWERIPNIVTFNTWEEAELECLKKLIELKK